MWLKQSYHIYSRAKKLYYHLKHKMSRNVQSLRTYPGGDGININTISCPPSCTKGNQLAKHLWIISNLGIYNYYIIFPCMHG